MRPRSRAATAGFLIAICALALAWIAIPTGGNAGKQPPHRHSAWVGQWQHPGHLGTTRIDARRALHRHRTLTGRRRTVHAQRKAALAQRRTIAKRHRAGVEPRRALGGRRGNPAQPGSTGNAAPTADTPAATPLPPSTDNASPQPAAATPPKGPPPVVSETDPGKSPPPPPAESPSPPTPPAEPAPTPPVPPPSTSGPSIYWGASIGDHLTGTQAPWDMGAVSQFEAMANKPLSLINFFAPFANCANPSACYFYGFATGPMESIRQHGAIPVFTWASQSIPSDRNEPDFQLADVIAGAYDPYIREFAEDARDWGHPFFLRFNWEMNGAWFPWAEGANGNQPGEYVAAWRHVHDVFTEIGADNATWVWCPNVDPDNTFQDLDSLYPGDAYVDWTGLDGYNWGTNPAKPDRWRSFDQLYDSTYRRIAETIAPSKPMLIGEMGSTEYGGSKASWIEDGLARIPAGYPKIRGLLWFDTYDDGMDWPIETSASATSAFAAGIQSPAYAINEYADLDGSPIQPPN